MNAILEKPTQLTKADFTSNQTVRWCPGCGDYSILANVQKTLPEIGVSTENSVFVSGIGCSSRFPYYMNTYGFHTIHGRAPAVATGLKLANPELNIWIVTGDGDGLSIGGNHLLHICRRNLDVTILLFNNRIYGLTKGQYSPTSEQGKITKSTPTGSVDFPLHPIAVALAAEATFVARSLDVDAKGLQTVLKAAHEHKGTSFVEIYQNCNIFNDGAFSYVADRKERSENMLVLEDGKPLIYGKEQNQGIRLNGLTLERVSLEEDGVRKEDLFVHDVNDLQGTRTHLLSTMHYPQFPVPMGIFRKIQRPTYEELMGDQVNVEIQKKGKGNLQSLLAGNQNWEVKS